MLSIFYWLSFFILLSSSHTPKRQPTHSCYTHTNPHARALGLISYCPASSVISGQPFLRPTGIVGLLTGRLKRLAENKEMCQKENSHLFHLCPLASGRWMADTDMESTRSGMSPI